MTVGGLLSTGSMFWLTQLKERLVLPGDDPAGLHLMPAAWAPSSCRSTNTALIGVADHDAGVASAMVNTTQQVGGSLGIALLNTVFTTTIINYGTNHHVSQFAVASQLHGYNVAFTISAILLGVSTLITFLMIRKDPEETVITAAGAGETESKSSAPAPVVA